MIVFLILLFLNRQPCAASSPIPAIAATSTTPKKTQEPGKPSQIFRLPPVATPQSPPDKPVVVIPYPSRTAASSSKVHKPYGTPRPLQPSEAITNSLVYIPPSKCGGIRGLSGCAEGETCIDDPFASDDDDADSTGYCVRLNDSVCGPVFEVACPSSLQTCVDDPREECVGGVCPGTCVFLDLEAQGEVSIA